MKLTLHHLKNGTFAAEVPTDAGNVVVFSTPYDTDPGHSDQYTVLAEVLRRTFGLNLPPISETNLFDPGEDTVEAIQAATSPV